MASALRAVFRSPIFLVFVSCCVGLLLVEGILRVVGYRTSTWWDSRYEFLSANSLRNLPGGVVGYQPNRSIREVGVYDIFRPRVEYDYFFPTNNLGLVQSADVACGAPTVAIVGDSFTQGQGSPPWVEGLIAMTKASQGMQIANLGVSVTGITQWQAALKYYRGCLDIRKVIIPFIADDWGRISWTYSDTQLKCIEGMQPCIDPWDNYHRIGGWESQQELYQRTALRRVERLNRLGARWWRLAVWHERLKSASYVYALVQNLWEARLMGRKPLDLEAHFAENAAALTGILDDFGRENVALIFIPDRAEHATGSLNPLSRRVQEWLAARGIAAATCDLGSDGFMPVDPHPNRRGYERLMVCARSIVAAWLPPAKPTGATPAP